MAKCLWRLVDNPFVAAAINNSEFLSPSTATARQCLCQVQFQQAYHFSTHVCLVLFVNIPHEDPEGVAAQLPQLQVAAAELKVTQLDATQPAGEGFIGGGRFAGDKGQKREGNKMMVCGAVVWA